MPNRFRAFHAVPLVHWKKYDAKMVVEKTFTSEKWAASSCCLFQGQVGREQACQCRAQLGGIRKSQSFRKFCRPCKCILQQAAHIWAAMQATMLLSQRCCMQPRAASRTAPLASTSIIRAVRESCKHVCSAHLLANCPQPASAPSSRHSHFPATLHFLDLIDSDRLCRPPWQRTWRPCGRPAQLWPRLW